MDDIPDLSDFSELSGDAKKQRIDDMNNYLWDNNWSEIEKKKEIILEVIEFSEQINYIEGLAFSTLILGVFFCNKESIEAIPYLNRSLTLYQSIRDSTGTIRCKNNLGNIYRYAGLFDKSLDYYQEAASLAEETGNLYYQAMTCINIGMVYSDLKNDLQAKPFLFKALKITQNYDLGDGVIHLYQVLGDVLYRLGELKNAQEYYIKALDSSRKFNQTSLEPYCLTNLGEYYQIEGQLEKALEYHTQALKKVNESFADVESIIILSNLGHTLYLKKDYENSLLYLKRALTIADKLSHNFRSINIYNLLSKVEKANKNFESALTYQELFSEKIQELYTTNTERKISTLLADFKYRQSEQDKEIFRLRNVELKKKSDQLEESYNNISTISSIGKEITSTIKLEEVLDAVYEGVNSIMAADVFGIALLDKSTEEIDYRFFIENSIRIFPPRISIRTENSLAAKCIIQNKEIKIDDTMMIIKDGAQKHETDNPQITQSLIIIPLIAEEDIIGILTVQSYRKKQYTDYHMDMLNALGVYIASAITNSVNHEVLTIANQEKGKYLTEILDSIRYAERIQRSMLPAPEILKSLLPNSFFLWQPKDIVGGDAYYLEPLKNGFYIALFDCTGHGVPGAMMTMMATVFLRRIIVDYKSSSPSTILRQLNIIIKNFLKQDREETLSDDGLDAAVCFVNPEKKKLMYAGAKLPLYYLSNGEIIKIKGDKQSIGYKKSDLDYQYTDHEIQIQNNSTFYLTTDGYIDQIGGEKGYPLGRKRFTKLLKENQNEDMEKQGEILKLSLKEYMGEENPQVDDITVIGFKI